MAGEAVKIALIITTLLFSAGCEQKAVKVVQVQTEGQNYATSVKELLVKETELTREQKITLLRTEAKKRGLSWRVVCMPWVEEGHNNMLAIAHRRGIADADDHNDRWIEEGNTQEDAAYALYIAIQGDPTHPAEPIQPPMPEKRHKMCAPELRGNY